MKDAFNLVEIPLFAQWNTAKRRSYVGTALLFFVHEKAH
jgi:hypothetical protein